MIHSRRFSTGSLESHGLGIKLQAETGGTYYDAPATAFEQSTQGAVKLITTATGITTTGTVNVNSAYSSPIRR